MATLMAYAVIAALGQGVLALAVNVASETSPWFGPFEVVRVHPWWAAAILTALISLLAALTVRAQLRTGSTERSSATETEIGSTGAMTGQPEDPRAVTQGDRRVHNDHRASEITARSADIRRNSVTVVHTVIPPLPPAWERQILDAVETVERSEGMRVICRPVDVGNGFFDDTDAYVVMFPSAFWLRVSEEVRVSVRRCRANNPSARILVVGCGIADDPVAEEALCEAIRGWGVSGPWNADVFGSTGEFVGWLTEYVNIAVSSARQRQR